VLGSSLKAIFTSVAISLLLLFSGCETQDSIFDSVDKDTNKIKKSTNQAPIFTNAKTKSVNENQKSAITLEVNNSNKDILTYSISGRDANSFNIDPFNGVVTFKTAPNYETKSSYSFKATVADGKEISTIKITININNIDETKQGQLIDIDTNKTKESTKKTLKFTNANTKSVNENQKSAITLEVNDSNKDTLTYSMSGTDANNFNIDPFSGIVTFKTAPDYETKSSYNFKATVSDGKENATIEITININDIDEVEQGQLIDSAINGVKYETNSGLTGKTDDNGTFRYNKTDKTISFTVGKLIIAKDFNLSKLNNDGKILPSDIIGVARNNTTNQKLVKLLRVLQSLDNDNNANNGIFIDDNTKGYLTEEINIIDVNISKFETIVKNAQKRFVSQRKSREHYIKTLKSMSINPEVVPFITIWKTTSNDENITISINADYKSDYDYTVDWADGNITKNINDSITHIYSNEGNHTVKISGEFPAIRMLSADNSWNQTPEEAANAQKLQKITQWGDIAWSSFLYAFPFCYNLEVNATDTPSLSDVHSMIFMFYRARKLKGNKYFNDWDVSSVTNMSGMFADANAFNQPLNNWDVSSVTNIYSMFFHADAFNQPLNNWDDSSVTNMSMMFEYANAFNQPLNDWNVSSVTNMSAMFQNTRSFTNQDLSSWNVNNVSSDKHASFVTNTGGGNTEPNW
jgi:surface protein